MDATARADLQLLARYLARRDVVARDLAPPGRTFDVLVLCGSAVLASLDVAARAVHDGVVRSVLVTGGRGHSTPHLEAAVRAHPAFRDVPTGGRTEAAVLAEILHRHLAVPAAALDTEERSGNCGQNAEFSLRVLAERPGRPSVLLVQDPTMQRRTHAGFDHHQRHAARPLEVVSYAPFVPVIGPHTVGAGPGADRAAWSLDRFVRLVLGEIRRLRDDERGYGPRGAGFIGHVEVPDTVLAADRRLRAVVPATLRGR